MSSQADIITAATGAPAGLAGVFLKPDGPDPIYENQARRAALVRLGSGLFSG